MKTEWMGKYREMVESIIYLCNSSSTGFVTPFHYGTEYKITAREAQVIEYLLEDTSGNMVSVANRLGVTRGAFSNIVNKLVAKGFLTKERRGDNKKNIYPVVTSEGEKVYEQYSHFIYEFWFKEMFKKADLIPAEYIRAFSDILKGMGDSMAQMKD
ncbi:MarR family winged helix-turn-helix transcriptional regulator [Oribacterium sp. P6A1]|uniref:MarR family winged helix-turn-helix transcriptional regulator n=1 Tax=Oribacterium sp. P6A1 TaxID=1410612 RepID=UPI00068B67AE|nr:MarR family winged helix-turn-helix transcriptional regulator [Oribacterium sp. P6A1]